MNQEGIKQAFSVAGTGKEFPMVVHLLKNAGVKSYDFILEQGISIFYGEDGSVVANPPRFEQQLHIAETFNTELLQASLKVHQQGETDFMTFVHQAAEAGCVKWITDMKKMTVIYI